MWSWTKDLLVAYGRHPWKALGWSAVFIVIGAICFPEQGMERHRIDRRQPHGAKPAAEIKHEAEPYYVAHALPYSRFLYSLDLFIPLIELGLADAWLPMKAKRWKRRWMRIHQIAGWILVPLGLAALGGIVK